MLCTKCKTDIADDSKFCNMCGQKQSNSAERKSKTRGNGTGCVYQLPDGRWKSEVVIGWYTDPLTQKSKKKRRTGVFQRKKDALSAIPKLLNRQDTTPHLFNTLYAVWSKKHFANLSKSKETAYVIAYNKCESLHWREITEIKLTEMQNVVDEKGKSYYTKRDIRDLLSLMWRYAMQNDQVEKNYAEFIELPPLQQSNKDAFSAAEIQSFWNDYDGRDKDGKIDIEQRHPFTGYILIMIYTGMRYGEISTILLDNIFLDKCYMIGGIKTDAGKNREILICKKIVPVVSTLLIGRKKKLLEMNEDNFREKYKETIERAQVRPLSPHCCRHTTATALALAGTPGAIIKDIMGHKNYATTVGYTHIKLEDKLSEINKI